MAGLNTLTERQVLETKYRNSRSNLLFVLIFTAINILLLVAQTNTYFLFSAYIPYALVSIGMLLCGMYPAEYYGQDYSSMEFFGPVVFAVFLAIALIVITFYFVSWLCSKNNKVGWLIFALVFFAIDTIIMLMFTGFQIDGIIDIVFHVWVIVSLFIGIISGNKLKKLPEESVEAPAVETGEQEENVTANSSVIRIADCGVKSRVLLEADALGHKVIYRRVKKVNELVIDGNVYGEYVAMVEFAHSLKAQIDGHLIEVGYDGVAQSYLKVDGQTVAKKLRLY